MRRLKRWLDLPPARRRLLLEAAWQLLRARQRILLGHLRRRRPGLGTPAAAGPLPLTAEQEATVRQVRWAVGIAARHVPWNAVCLPQAMAAKTMLARRGIASVLFLGLRRGREARVQAHAWLCSGRLYVTGYEPPMDFTCIARFQ